MLTLREIIKNAWEQKKAIPHINIADMAMFNAVVTVAKKHDTPIIIGVSEGERTFLGSKTNSDAGTIRAQRRGAVIFKC